MILLCCGGREFAARDVIIETLERAEARWPGALTVVEGGARGADRIAGAWAAVGRARGVGWVHVVARWTEHWGADECAAYGCAGEGWTGTCRAAGFRRNQELVDYCAAGSLVLAFKDAFDWSLARGGTEDCVRRALAAGLETWVVGSDGTWRAVPGVSPAAARPAG